MLLLCAQYQVNFCSVCKNRFYLCKFVLLLYMSLIFVSVSCSEAAALLLDNHTMPIQAQKLSQTLHHGLQNKFFMLSGKLGCHVLPNTWHIPPDTAQPSNTTRQPHLLPVVSRPENLSSSRYITAQKSVRVFFCLPFPLSILVQHVTSQNE